MVKYLAGLVVSCFVAGAVCMMVAVDMWKAPFPYWVTTGLLGVVIGFCLIGAYDKRGQ